MEKCQFCKALPKHHGPEGEIISYTCGTIAGDQEPRTKDCWRRYADYLKERLEAWRGLKFKPIMGGFNAQWSVKELNNLRQLGEIE
jgi:hypothetical protein